MKFESNIYSNQNNNIVMRTMKYFLSLLLLLVINIHVPMQAMMMKVEKPRNIKAASIVNEAYFVEQ